MITASKRLATVIAFVVLAWSTQSRGDDWASDVVAAQKSLANLGVQVNGGVTVFAQGLLAGAGKYDWPVGGKADLYVALDGSKLGLWNGFYVNSHFEQNFGQSANTQGDGSVLPVNTALGFPTLGGTTSDLSLNVTQKFGERFSISLGKFNMLDAASQTPLIGGGGEKTFWNLGIAAPASGVTPPYLFGGIASLKTDPATFTVMIYDPRNAQNLDVISHPFEAGTTMSLSATVPLNLFGLPGYHSFRGVYSTAEGFDFEKVPQLLLPPASQSVLTRQGYYYFSYSVQQFVWSDPDHPGKGWGFFAQLSASDANPNPIGNVLLVGVGGSVPGRANDRWGVAWSDYLFSGHLKRGLSILGQRINDERILEAYYDAAIAPHLRLGPDAQIIWPATPGKSTAFFLGLRGRVVF